MHMNIFTIKENGLILLLFLAILPSCRQSGRNDAAVDQPNPDIIKREVILSPETQDMLNRIPTPFEVALILQEAKAPFVFSLTNPPANINKYFTQKTKALNLGIYSVDLAYSSAYQRTAETEKFIFCTGKLADDLGIGGVYDKTLVEKIINCKNNRDSLVLLIKRIFGETNDFLRRNNRNQVAVLVAAGSFVEGIYIASSLCQLVPDNSRIAAIIYGQRASLDKLLRILGEYGMDSTVKPVADDLGKFKPIFTDYGLGSGKTLPPQKVAGIVEIAGQIRSSMIK
jgi:hypothetical protein